MLAGVANCIERTNQALVWASRGDPERVKALQMRPYGRLKGASRDPLGRDSQPKQRLHLVDCLIGLRMRWKRRHELAHQRYRYRLGHFTSPVEGGLSKHKRVI